MATVLHHFEVSSVPMDETVAFENETARIATRDNVLVVRWADAPRTTVELKEFAKTGKLVADRFGKRAVFANVIVSGTPSFSQEVRDEVARLTATPMFHLGTAQIILVQGLAGVAVRAFLSTAFLVSRAKAPNKVFGDLTYGIDWMHARLREGPVSWTREALAAFVESIVGR